MALEEYGLDQIFMTRAMAEDMWSSNGYYNELLNASSLPAFDTDFANADISFINTAEAPAFHGIFNSSNLPTASAIVQGDIVHGDTRSSEYNFWDYSGHNSSKFHTSDFETFGLQNELEQLCCNAKGVSHDGAKGVSHDSAKGVSHDGGSLCLQKNILKSTTTEESCYVTGGFHPYEDIEQNGRSVCTKSNSNTHNIVPTLLNEDKTVEFDRTGGKNNAKDDLGMCISDKTEAHTDVQSPQDYKTNLEIDNITENQGIIKNEKPLAEENVVSKDDDVNIFLKTTLTSGEASPSNVKAIAVGGNKGKGQPAKNLYAERRRRKRLNDRLCMLRSVVPTISKMDRTSILSDTIEYTKQLLNQIRHLHEEFRPQAEWPAHLRPYAPYFGSASDQYFADKTIPKFEVQRTDGRHLNIHIACQANPNLLLSTVGTLESFGLEIQHGIFSCFSDFGMQAQCSETEKGNGNTRPEDIKLALLQKAGYLGKNE